MNDTPLTNESVNDTALEDKNQPHTDWVTAHSCRLIERRLNAAKNIIADLLANPYPHDLMAIRKEAAGYFSEDLARQHMETYCTEEFMLKARADWNAAQETARELLKKP